MNQQVGSSSSRSSICICTPLSFKVFCRFGSSLSVCRVFVPLPIKSIFHVTDYTAPFWESMAEKPFDYQLPKEEIPNGARPGYWAPRNEFHARATFTPRLILTNRSERKKGSWYDESRGTYSTVPFLSHDGTLVSLFFHLLTLVFVLPLVIHSSWELDPLF